MPRSLHEDAQMISGWIFIFLKLLLRIETTIGMQNLFFLALSFQEPVPLFLHFLMVFNIEYFL